MTLVWHILRKDLRHAWIYAAGALFLLLLNQWRLSGILRAGRGWQIQTINTLFPVDALLFVSLGLLCGALVLAERIPGVRQYWLARPIRWQSLLSAKSLLLVLLIVLPMTLLHLTLVAWRGFPLLENAGAIVWNAFLLVLISTLPVAVLASVSRNMQHLILWALSIAAVTLVVREAIPGRPGGFPDELRLLLNSVTVVIGIIGGVGILLYQYSARRTWVSRIAVAGLCLLLLSLQYWPVGIWYGLRRATSPNSVGNEVATFSVKESELRWGSKEWARTWVGSPRLLIPYYVTGLPEGGMVDVNEWRLARVGTGAENDASSTISSIPPAAGETGALMLRSESGFLERNSGLPIDIDVVIELTIYGTPRYHTIPVQGEASIPGAGHCRSDTEIALLVDCQTVLGSGVRVRGYWTKGTPAKNSTVVLTQREERPPFPLVPLLHPISVSGGGFSAKSDYSSKDIVFEIREPIAHVQRRIELRGIRLADLSR